MPSPEFHYILFQFQDHQPDEQFWKYALTGSCQNTELKLWSCENWTCLQTVQIKHTPSGIQDGKPMALKAVLDLSAQYLLLSDIHRKIVYVLQLEIKDDRVSQFFKAKYSAFDIAISGSKELFRL